MNLIEALKRGYKGWVRSKSQTQNRWVKLLKNDYGAPMVVPKKGEILDFSLSFLESEDWEPKPDDKLWSINELMEGKVPGSVKVQGVSSLNGYFIPYFIDNDGYWVGLDHEGYTMQQAANNQDWTLYTEPRKKVAMYLWAVRMGSTWLPCPDNYYATEEDLRKEFPEITWCQRLDDTRIEVDEDRK